MHIKAIVIKWRIDPVGSHVVYGYWPSSSSTHVHPPHLYSPDRHLSLMQTYLWWKYIFITNSTETTWSVHFALSLSGCCASLTSKERVLALMFLLVDWGVRVMWLGLGLNLKWYMEISHKVDTKEMTHLQPESRWVIKKDLVYRFMRNRLKGPLSSQMRNPAFDETAKMAPAAREQVWASVRTEWLNWNSYVQVTRWTYFERNRLR